MKFKVGDTVMLKAVPYDNFTSINSARAYYDIAVKYTIGCRGMRCNECPNDINGDVKICEFVGTKKQVKAHIKRYWPQPKIKAVK